MVRASGRIAAAGALGMDACGGSSRRICTVQMAHDAGIVHRDLKPGNIVAHRFGGGERAYKLVDFGLAALKDTGADETRLTGAFMFVGTVAYAAPEQVEGQLADARTDVFSLASVVYEMLTGRPPYGAGGVYETLAKQASGTVVPPSQVRPEVPSSLDEIVLKGLARDRHARWASAAEFGRAHRRSTRRLRRPSASPTGWRGFAARCSSARRSARGGSAARCTPGCTARSGIQSPFERGAAAANATGTPSARVF